jgi:hypothetical protein
MPTTNRTRRAVVEFDKGIRRIYRLPYLINQRLKRFCNSSRTDPPPPAPRTQYANDID